MLMLFQAFQVRSLVGYMRIVGKKNESLRRLFCNYVCGQLYFGTVSSICYLNLHCN